MCLFACKLGNCKRRSGEEATEVASEEATEEETREGSSVTVLECAFEWKSLSNGRLFRSVDVLH